jgi:trk system potassium uptake protein TrkH
MAIPSVVSIIYKEWYSAWGFLLSASITLGSGYLTYKIFNDAEEPQYNHAFIIAASGWLAITLMGSIPFFIIANITPTDVMNGLIPPHATYNFSSLLYFKNPLHCFFESMSAYTTTGLTMAVHEPSVGKGVLLYRSIAQWVGGAGFIVMVIAIFRHRTARSAMLLYNVESTGEKLTFNVKATARVIWKVYLLLTVFSAIYLIIGTYIILPDYPLKEIVFDAINHAMTGQSTGGFSTLDDSIAGYNSSYMDMLYLLPMILGSFSIPFFYKVIYEKKYSEIWNDIQIRSLIISYIAGGLILAYLLFRIGIVSEPIREGIFQFISAMSTTGWQTSNIGNWDWVSTLFIVSAAMLIGGSYGATVGGIKMIRALTIIKGLAWQINKVFFSEHEVKITRFNGKSFSSDEINEEFTKATSLLIMFFLLIMGSSIIGSFLVAENFNFANIIFESTSAQSTVGLSTGITSPEMSPFLETIFIFQMWAGRLEIIPVLALFRAIIWGTSPLKKS